MAQDNVKSNTRTPPELRLPKNYRLVHEILREQDHGTHLSVADIYALAQGRQPGIGATTVYRALARLRTLGLISEIALPGADHAYYETSTSPHAHFRCDTCGKVDDVDFILSRRIVGELARKHDADVTDVSLTLHGRCASCRDRGA